MDHVIRSPSAPLSILSPSTPADQSNVIVSTPESVSTPPNIKVTIPLSKKDKSKNNRSKYKKPSRPCCFCGVFQTKLTRHMKIVHKAEPQIQEILKYSKKQQDEAFEKLRKDGIFQHNVQSIKEGKKNDCMLMERKQSKPKNKSVKTCVDCKGFFYSKYFYQHTKRCLKRRTAEQPSPKLVSGVEVGLIGKLEENEDQGFLDIIGRFAKDEAGNLCRTNQMLLHFGRNIYSKHCVRKEKMVEGRRIVMQNMRTLATLFVEFRSVFQESGKDTTRLDFKEMFVRDNFPSLRRAIDAMSEDKTGTKLLIGNVIKRVVKVMKGVYLIQKQDDLVSQLDKFVDVLTYFWNDIFKPAEIGAVARRQEILRKPSQLPKEEEVKKLVSYVSSSIEEKLKLLTLDSENFVDLRNLVVTRITLFNARRGGEPSRILLSEWESAKRDEWVDADRLATQFSSEEERNEFLEDKLLYQFGKGSGKLVPVISNKEILPALDMLSDPLTRDKCGIHKSNKFLFPSTKGSLDHVAGYHCINTVTKQAGLSTRLTATAMRHRASTIHADSGMSEVQKQLFFEHMGHGAEVNKDVYQCPAGSNELFVVGKYLRNIDGRTMQPSKLRV